MSVSDDRYDTSQHKLLLVLAAKYDMPQLLKLSQKGTMSAMTFTPEESSVALTTPSLVFMLVSSG